MSFKESYVVPKDVFDDLVKGRRVKKRKAENIGQYERRPSSFIMKKKKKKHHTTAPKRDVLMEELLRLGAKFPGNVKKNTTLTSSSKKHDAGEYFLTRKEKESVEVDAFPRR